MLLTVIGALIGLFALGYAGILPGAIIGYVASMVFQRQTRASPISVGNLFVDQSELVRAAFSVMGAVCKADNITTRDETQMVEQIYTALRVVGEYQDIAKEAFKEGKQSDFDLDGAVDRLAASTRGVKPLAELFLHFLFMAAEVDRRVHPTEHDMIVRIAKRLGLSEQEVAQLESTLRVAAAAGRGFSSSNKDRLADAYTVMGLTPESTRSQIDRAYRELVDKSRPDNLVALGLPENMRAIAEDRSRVINSAYEIIQSSRSSDDS